MDSSVAGLVQNSIWLFDVPFVFIIQVAAMSATETPAPIAAFTSGVFLILIMTSTLTLDEKQIWLVTFSGVGAVTALQVLAGDAGGGRKPGAVPRVPAAERVGAGSGWYWRRLFWCCLSWWRGFWSWWIGSGFLKNKCVQVARRSDRLGIVGELLAFNAARKEVHYRDQ